MYFFHIGGIIIVFQHTLGVDVADTGVAAFGLACGPAGDFQALKTHFCRGVDGFFKVPAVQNGGQQSEMKHKTFPLSCFFIQSKRRKYALSSKFPSIVIFYKKSLQIL